MAPAASILAATSAAAAASSKRPAASEAEQLADSSAPPQPVDDDASRGKSQQHPKQQQLPCPRCRSTNTKFCYYNNYSTAQPRHFCRACRRYWTHGGTLRDVPVGGATRRGGKRRRVSAEPPNSSATTTTTARPEDDLSDAAAAAFPFLSDGSYYLPLQIDIGGLFAPAASSSWPSSVVPDFFDGLAPWDDGTVGAGAPTGAWSDIAGLDLTWPPPGN